MRGIGSICDGASEIVCGYSGLLVNTWTETNETNGKAAKHVAVLAVYRRKDGEQATH